MYASDFEGRHPGFWSADGTTHGHDRTWYHIDRPFARDYLRGQVHSVPGNVFDCPSTSFGHNANPDIPYMNYGQTASLHNDNHTQARIESMGRGPTFVPFADSYGYHIYTGSSSSSVFHANFTGSGKGGLSFPHNERGNKAFYAGHVESHTLETTVYTGADSWFHIF